MQIPEPYLYQAWKHHLPFLKERLARAVVTGPEEAGVPEGLKKMGDSVTDLYIGEEKVDEVLEGISEKLGKELLTAPEAYRKWLGAAGYKNLILADGSEWVLKHAGERKHWLHFHPARRSPLSVRVRGKTLRTAFMVCLEAEQYGVDPMSKELLDRVRTNYMGLSPVRSLDRRKGLGKTIGLLER